MLLSVKFQIKEQIDKASVCHNREEEKATLTLLVLMND